MAIGIFHDSLMLDIDCCGDFRLWYTWQWGDCGIGEGDLYVGINDAVDFPNGVFQLFG